MKKITTFILVAAFFSSVAFVNAQTNSLRANIQNQKIEAQQIKANIQENRQDFKNTATTTRANIQNQIQVQKTNINERLENAATPEERKNVLMEAKKMREVAQANIAESRSNRKEQSIAGLDRRMDIIVKKFKAYLERGYSVAERINVKLDELSESAVDVSTEKEMYQEAKDLLSLANSKTDEAYKIYGTMDGTFERSQTQEEFKKVKELLGEARVSLKEAYQVLREIVQNLKKQKPTLQIQEAVAR